MLGETARPRGILFVCTGNICRSPYAERRLRRLLPDAGVPISSAGTAAVVDADLDEHARAALVRVGADVDGFAARQLTPQLLDEAALVLTMTRAQRAEAARLRPVAMSRIFTLGDFADLCADTRAWRRLDLDRPWLPQVVEEAAAARGTTPPRPPEEVDVADPYGHSTRTHEESYARIEQQLGLVVRALGSVVASAQTAAGSSTGRGAR